ncbi:hypothetical protein NQ317_018570 [Molorchus minor]|uniref:RRM domain-containing protein n=1 Tax=Molorchus minor TaxID=1323400 RepID=A0ABQ9JX57_9CUCU|nr:hypothetical protein NQ317_018570 [Molorchus minor]
MTTTAKIPPITMSKLYVGNLPTETSESALRQLFLEQNLSCTSILVKRGGYAFVDCPDQSSADRAIDKLNAMCYADKRDSHTRAACVQSIESRLMARGAE